MTIREEAHPGRQRDFLQAILDATDSGIMVIDKSGPALFANARLYDIWRFPRALRKNHENGRLLLRYMLDQLEEPAGLPSDTRAFGFISSEMATEIRLKGGRVLEVFAGPLVIDGLATGGIYQFRDVTGRWKAAEALRGQVADFREENRRLRSNRGDRYQPGGDIGKSPAITGDMLDEMLRHDWPGSARELQDVLLRLISLGRLDIAGNRAASHPAAGDVAGLLREQEGNTYQAAMENFEKSLFVKALENNQWHRGNAARALGLPLRTFYRKMKRLGLVRRR